MPVWKASVRVMLKKGVLDPQGNAVQRSLGALGYPGIERVRVGKYMEVILSASDRDEASRRVEEMGKKLLANPVIEDFSFDIEEVAETVEAARRR